MGINRGQCRRTHELNGIDRKRKSDNQQETPHTDRRLTLDMTAASERIARIRVRMPTNLDVNRAGMSFEISLDPKSSAKAP